jgi:cysteine desulfurase/selenocysteine lyase
MTAPRMTAAGTRASGTTASGTIASGTTASGAIAPGTTAPHSIASREDFPLLDANPDLHYLDSAATSQKPSIVLEAMTNYYTHDNANPHRGAYALSARATDRYHQAREHVAAFVGVRDAARLIFTRGTTESLNLVATAWGGANVRRDDEIVITGLEHHANFVPWQQLANAAGARLRICDITPDGRVDIDALRTLVNARTKVVAFNHVSNALGTINPVHDMAAIARAGGGGAVVVCDGAQAAPHLPLDIDALDVDFYAFSGHKMLGPMGCGVLVGRRSLLESMPPYQTGGDMIEYVADDRSTWNVLPHKFEAGTPNVADAVGLAAACGYLDGLGMAAVRAHEQTLTAYATERLSAIPEVRVYGPPPEARSGVASFTVGDIHPHDLATILDERDVCIRAGHHCAQPLMRRLNVPATARASFYVYNTEADVDALVDGVKHARTVFG